MNKVLKINDIALKKFVDEIETRSGRKTAIVSSEPLDSYFIYSLRSGAMHSVMAVVGRSGLKYGMIYAPNGKFTHGMAKGNIFTKPELCLTDGGRVHYINHTP